MPEKAKYSSCDFIRRVLLSTSLASRARSPKQIKLTIYPAFI
jgi:hypothetical protein